MFRRAFVLLACTLALAGCVDTPDEGGSPPPAAASGPQLTPAPRTAVEATPIPAAPDANGATAQSAPVASTTAPPGSVVALLAPLTGPNAERGKVLMQAAQLALELPGAPQLDVRDTGGTADGAAAAAQAALAAGAGLIIGPLTAAETAAVAAPARAAGVAVLAFTNDSAQAQPGVWTLGITPAQQVRRLIGAVQADGKNRVTAILPPSDFGSAVGTALTQALASAGAPAPDIHVHDGNTANIATLLRDVSDYANRRGPIDARIKAARKLHTAAGRKEAAELSKRAIPPPSFDALLLADSGDTVAWEASFLGYYDLDPPAIRLIGPSLWATPAGRGGAALLGAWYAAPDPAARSAFEAAYHARFDTSPPSLADFAYDAAAIGRVLAASGGYSVASLCRPEGFAGVDGLLALQPDGSVRRGLAVFEIRHGGPEVVVPAPDTIAAPGI